MKKLDNLQQQSDHDILITLVETVKNNHSTVLDKISDVKSKVQEVNDGISTRVADHDLRIRTIEKLLETTAPVESLAELKKVVQWKKEFQFTWKVIVAVAAITGGIVGFLLSTVGDLLSLAGRR